MAVTARIAGETRSSFRRAHLRYFVAVAEERQITRAAARLNIAQPALSRAINDLESHLGLQLFDRHARGVTLTPAGATLYAKARDAVEALTQATELAQALARSATETIVFGFFGAPPVVHSPGLLNSFAQAHPAVEMSFHELGFPVSRVTDWLRDVDVVLSHLPPADPNVWVQPLRSEPRYVVAHRDHPLAGQRKLSLAEVVDETFVGFDNTIDAEWAGFWSFDDHRGYPPARLTRDRARSPQEAFAAISKARAITAMPSCHAMSLASGTRSIVAIPVVDAEPCTLCLAGLLDRRNATLEDLLERATLADPSALSPSG